MKKLLAILAVLALAAATPVLATSAMETEIPRFLTAYEGNGVVELDFRNDVRYRNLSVTAVDPLGAAQSVVILETDDDELTFRIENALDETVYTFTVGGIEFVRGSGEEIITGEVATPAAGHTVIQSVERDDGELEIELMGPVEYGDVTVTLTGPGGENVDARIVERDGDGLEVRTGALTPGEEYTVTVTGVGLRGSGVSGTVTRSFIAR